jgi:xanthine/CO dehydrogenase XdhC/CoxF family maturation factor
MLARDEDILKAAEDWRKAGRGVALATVVETWGSAPRPARFQAAASKARW